MDIVCIKNSLVLSRGRPVGPLFNCYYIEVYGRALLLPLDCSTWPLIITLLCLVLSKVASSTIFWVFGITRPGIEPRPPRPLANPLHIRPIAQFTLDFIFLLLANPNCLRCKVKLVTLVKGDSKVPFSLATTPRCRRGRNSFS